MVVVEGIKIEMSACNGWRSNPLTPHYATIDDPWVKPVIVPCYNGKSLQIREELVVNGLSAISIKHHKGNCLLSDREDEIKDGKRKSSINKYGMPVCLGERMKRRNSFWNMHRPELSKLTWPKNYISSEMLQDFFHDHLRTHGTFCDPLHIRDVVSNEELRDYTILRELVPATAIPPDGISVGMVEKSRPVQLNDEDFDPEIKISKLRLKSSTGLQRESFLPKESEEVISSSITTHGETVVEDSRDPSCLTTVSGTREEEGETGKLEGK